MKEITYLPSNVKIREIMGYTFYICQSHTLDFYTIDAYNLHVEVDHDKKFWNKDRIKYGSKLNEELNLNKPQKEESRFKWFR